VDLFSYSPHIKIGDVHALAYPDSSIDVVVCGWVLEFCSDVTKACAEIKRVTKPGGVICVGGMHHPSSTDMQDYNKHKQHEDRAWYCSIPMIKSYFGVADADFVFRSDIEPDDLDKRGDVVAIFKNATGHV
jgi:malonyl-CoA O-methyltransferase